MSATLKEQLLRLNEQIDKVMQDMAAEGISIVSIAYTDMVLRPAYEVMLRVQNDKLPITDVDEAMVAVISSMLFDYFQRIHPKNDRIIAIDHLNLIGQDITERVMSQIDAYFVPSIIVPTKH